MIVRRDFLKRVAAFFGMASVASRLPAEATRSTQGGFSPSDRILLGPQKVPTSLLMLGTGSSGWNGRSNQTRKLGVEGVADLFQAAFDKGVTTWDSADMYGSHPHLKAALQRGLPRDEITILTKSTSRHPKGMERDIERFLKELGTDSIDIFLLHCLTNGRWPEKMQETMAVVDRYQEKGVIRTKGVSCHSLSALKAAAASPWVEVDLARINPVGTSMDAGPETVVPVLDKMKDAGKGVIGMKLYGAGRLVNRREECLRYVLNLPCVDCFTVGFQSIGEFEETCRLIAAM